jgi:hypothetical protein
MASIFSLADNGLINFGNDNEITLTHVHNVGLTLTHTATGDDNLPVVLQLKSEENEIVANEVIASIEFAAGDSGGTDGATVAAGIHAIAEGTFSATANETKLVFTTGISETAASGADAKMTLSSLGDLDITGALTNTSGVLSFSDNIITTRNDIYAKNIKTSHLNNNTWKQLGSDIDGESGEDKFGYSVSLSANGKIVSIGAPLDDAAGDNAGHVRIYEFNESTLAWSQKGSDIDGEAGGNHSGLYESLSADGNTVSIGARYNDTSGNNNTGQVRIFRWDGSDWSLIGEVNGAAGDYFGHSNAISANGNTFVAGTYSHDSSKGCTRIYDYDGGSSWTQRGDDIDGDTAGDEEGYIVRISYDGNVIATGAQNDDDNGTDAGRVRVYYWNGSAWTQRGSDILGEAAGDKEGFAISLSADGNVIALGSKYHYKDAGETDVGDGHVRVFYWNGTAWTQRGINIEAEATDDKFGTHVSLSADGNTLIAGASDNDGGGADGGHARIFRWDGIKWIQIGADIDATAAGDNFGYQLGISSDGNTVAIGALFHDGNRGHVQIYTLGEYINGLSTGVVKSIAYTGTPEGGGIDASDAVSISVGEFNSVIVTTLFVDIGAGSILSSSTAGDVIGNDGVANAYITRITKAINGVVYKGEIICLEEPTTGDPDINVCANSSGTIAEDAAGEGQHVLANCGAHKYALRTEFTIPTDGIENDYIYLTHGGTTAQTYSAGKFLIRFYGAKDTGL